MYELEKNKKELLKIVTFSMFPPSLLHVVFAITYICMIFFFIGSQLDAKRTAPTFHLLISKCPDFSAIVKKVPKMPKTVVFGDFRE